MGQDPQKQQVDEQKKTNKLLEQIKKGIVGGADLAFVG